MTVQMPRHMFSPTQGIPPLAACFVRRDKLMHDIYEKLRSQRFVILSGLSGIGKTQIVSKLLRTPDNG